MSTKYDEVNEPILDASPIEDEEEDGGTEEEIVDLEQHRVRVLHDLAVRIVETEAAMVRLAEVEKELADCKVHATKAKRPIRNDGGVSAEELDDFLAELRDRLHAIPDEVAAQLTPELRRELRQAGIDPEELDADGDGEITAQEVSDFVYPHDRSKPVPFAGRYYGHKNHNSFEAVLRKQHQSQKGRKPGPAHRAWFGEQDKKGGSR